MQINAIVSLTFTEAFPGGFILNSLITIKWTNLFLNKSIPMIAPFWTFPSTIEPVCYWNATDYETIQEYLHIFKSKEGVVDFNATLLFATAWEYPAHVNIIVSYGSKINFLILLILTPRVSEFVLIK